MAITNFVFILFFYLFLSPLASQQPNTDAYFVSVFFQKMGASPVSYITDSSSSTDVCSWKGVSCDAQRDKVVSLIASNIGLTGPIPDITIGKLNKLQTLDVSGNSITALSSDFWELGNSIRTLNLSSNRIAGDIPNNIANLKSIESLDLAGNQFSGGIPASLGSLSSLRILNISNNLFNGSFRDEILGCTNLVSVDMSKNRLTGSLPKDFGVAFKYLKNFDVSKNDITGRVPDLSGLNSLMYLNLSGNMFQGSVVEVFQNNLQVIDLSNNHFQGHISQVNISSTFSWSSLVYLDLSMNKLSGELYTDLSEAQSLRHLNLAYNKFSPREFPRLGTLYGLEYLNLSKTGLTGKIPSDFAQLVSLKVLDLSSNHIFGSVPELGSKNLRVLDLSMNNLTGEIPYFLQQKLKNMSRFNFSYNNLTFCGHSFPAEIMNSAFMGIHNDCPIAANPQIFSDKGSKKKVLKLGLVIAFATFFLIAGLICLVFGLRKRNRSWSFKQKSNREEQNISGPFSFQTDSTTWVADVKQANSVPVVIFEKPLLNCTFADLLSATSHFDKATLLAEGRFGPVYKGFLPGGIEVAVKVLVHGSTVTDQEAAKELDRLGRIKHPNLVPLAGYCLAGDQRIAIYDYMENGNLQYLLHDFPGVQSTEDWTTDTWEEHNKSMQVRATELVTTWRFRHRIALGIARALSFLHHGCFPQIVHRDVKASSIYLDSAMEPRLADFGLSKLVGTNLDDEMSHGSLGYIPPEFSELENASATAKSDVYGFGVVLFELITGKKPIGDEYSVDEETSLVHWARTSVRRNEGLKLIDPKILETAIQKQIEEAMRIAYLCTADLPSKRPSMQQIVGLLKDIEPPDNH